MVVRRVTGTYGFLKVKVNICYSRDGTATDPLNRVENGSSQPSVTSVIRFNLYSVKTINKKSTFLPFLP